MVIMYVLMIREKVWCKCVFLLFVMWVVSVVVFFVLILIVILLLFVMCYKMLCYYKCNNIMKEIESNVVSMLFFFILFGGFMGDLDVLVIFRVGK